MSRLLFFIPLFFLASCSSTITEVEPCHSIFHVDIDLSIRSMDYYASMDWEAHRASYTEDGSVHVNSLNPEDLKQIDEAMEGYKAQRAKGDWADMFWSDRSADRVILDYPGLDPEPWVLVWGTWNGVLASSGDTVRTAVHISNRMSPEGLIRYHYVNIDRAPITSALAKK